MGKWCVDYRRPTNHVSTTSGNLVYQLWICICHTVWWLEVRVVCPKQVSDADVVFWETEKASFQKGWKKLVERHQKCPTVQRSKVRKVIYVFVSASGETKVLYGKSASLFELPLYNRHVIGIYFLENEVDKENGLLFMAYLIFISHFLSNYILLYFLIDSRQ